MEVLDEDGIEIVGGYLLVTDDFGVTLSKTHSVKTIKPEVTELVRGAIREAVEALPGLALRIYAAHEVESVKGFLKLTREDMIKVVCFAQERKYVEENTHRGLVKLPSAVASFYSRDVIRTAEVTEDFNVATAMGGLDDILASITAKGDSGEGNGNETGKDEKLEP
jgi:hypothetical protein